MYVTLENFPDVLTKLMTELSIGLDTETTGLSQSDRLFALIMATEKEEFYFNFQDYGDPKWPALNRLIAFQILGALFKQERIWRIQNAKFDMRMLAHEGVELKGVIHCTYAIERVLRNNYFGKTAYSLEGLAARRGWAKDDKVKEYADKHKVFTLQKIPGKSKVVKFYHFEKIPPEVMIPYGETDARLHYDVGADQVTQLAKIDAEADGKYPYQFEVLNTERRLTPVLYRMEKRGIMIDRDYTRNGMAYEQGKVQEAKAEFEKLTGEPYKDSKALFIKVFTAAGEEMAYTEKGNPSFTADVLEGMTTPVAEALNRIRHHEKKVSTYYSSFLHLVTPDGLIHADARQAGTESGRMSYRDPNLQNIPKEDSEPDILAPFLVRGCFVPRPGFVFHSIDYKTMEYAALMDYAGEMKIIDRLNAGEDFHQAIADEVGIPRKRAKTLNFLLGYGGGAGKVSVMLGIPLREARDLVSTYWGRLPKVERMMAQVRAAGKARGFIFNAFGRRNYLANNEWAYILPNHLIQGSCADTVKKAMVDIDSHLRSLDAESAMLLQVHDELLIETKIGEEDLIPRIQEIMSASYPAKNGVKMFTSVDHSVKSWSARDKVSGIHGQ